MSITKKIEGKIKFYSLNNPIMNRFFQNKRDLFLTKAFLSSEDYISLFTQKVTNKTDFEQFIDDAEQETPNYQYRHRFWHRSLGSWRWKGVYLHRDLLIDNIFDPNKKGIDFGGAYGPIAKHTTIVDFNKQDIFGRKVKTRNLDVLADNFADYLFSSHTFEHIEDLEPVILQIKKKVKKDGDIFLNLPAYTCKRWNSGLHTNRKFNDHAWTFYLEKSKQKPPSTMKNLMAIDTFLSKHFDLKIGVYTGDNSIFMHLVNNK